MVSVWLREGETVAKEARNPLQKIKSCEPLFAGALIEVGKKRMKQVSRRL
jgi:hypothetical protein